MKTEENRETTGKRKEKYKQGSEEKKNKKNETGQKNEH